MKQIEIGVGSLEQGLTEFVRMWRQVEAGERVKEASPRVNFESLLAALTRKRLEVLDTFASHPGLSIRALAARLGRDCKNMHGDVSVLAELGLIERSADRRLLSAPYDELVIHAPLKTAA